MSEINLHPTVAQTYGEIVATPYYQDGDIYRYAQHLIVSDENTSISDMKVMVENITENMEGHVGRDDNVLTESYQAIQDALAQLDEITIPKADFEAWVLQQIRTKPMIDYVTVLESLFAELMLIAYKHGSWQMATQTFEVEGWMDRLYHGGNRTVVADYSLLDKKDESAKSASEFVLNRNNPFADISIKNQRFIYASDYDRFNALELRTSRKITKVDKDEDRSFVTLQPGFNIRNSPKVEGGSTSSIRFDDTLTTELTQDDDKTYVYLDARSLSSE